MYFIPKRILFSDHAIVECEERGAEKSEVIEAIRNGVREGAKGDRWMYRMNFQFNGHWNGKIYAIKQVAPVVKENRDIIVITVYTFYF